VTRFRNPDFGMVSWNDLVKGPISISNTELDDLVIARGARGCPTYNFAAGGRRHRHEDHPTCCEATIT